MIEVKFYGINWWSREIYKTKQGTPIVKLEEGWYSLADPNDIDSEPCSRLKSDKIKIVEQFN